MHTFFVNTSRNISLARHERLFESLTARHMLYTVDSALDSLSETAGEIADLITRYEVVGDEYNLIVYVEIEGRNEVALATEKATDLLIEEELFGRLYALGRKPKGALILYGENFTRDSQYGRGRDYEARVRTALWDLFPLPAISEAEKRLADLNQDGVYPGRREYEDSFFHTMTRDQKTRLLSADSDLVRGVLLEVAESVRGEDVADVDLADELYTAVYNQREHVRLPVTGSPVQYAHIRLQDSDFHAKNRSEYNLLLYVYHMATLGELRLPQVQDGGDALESGKALGAAEIPALDFAALATVLKNRRYIFEQELMGLEPDGEGFPRFREALLEEPILLQVAENAPKLTLKVKEHRGLTLAGLRSAVNATLEEARDKFYENQGRIQTFITLVTQRFRQRKDAMNHIKVMEPEAVIENEDLTRNFIERKLRETGADMARRREDALTAPDVEGAIELCRRNTDYLFDVLRRATRLYVAGVLALLAFAVPYAVLQPDLWNEYQGWFFFLLTILCVAGAMTLGYGLFYMIYKGKISREVSALCDFFRESQRTREETLADYLKALSRDIPRSYALEEYKRAFDQYLARRQDLPVAVSYHNKCLSGYLRYVKNLISELDVTRLGTDPNPEEGYQSLLVPERDKYENDALYVVVDESDVDEIWLQPEGGEAL